MKNRNRKAFTLIEILLVVGFIALAGLVAYITFPKVQAAQRANAEATNINTMAAGVKNVFAAASNFTNLTEAVLIASRQVPEGMVNGAALQNSFSGAVTVAPQSMGSGTDNTFSITYTEVPTAECVKLATGVGNNFAAVGIEATAAAALALAKNPANTIKAYGSSNVVDIAVATTACAASSTVAMTFLGN